MDLSEMIRLGEASVRAHDAPSELAVSARSFLDCVAGWEGFTVEAASSAAERVLGAAMMLNPAIRGGRSPKTVILDVNIASGTTVSNAARRIRESVDTEWLIAVVITSLSSTDIRWSVPGVDSLFICRTDLGASERYECRENGVLIHALGDQALNSQI